jgi:hypothetical protein
MGGSTKVKLTSTGLLCHIAEELLCFDVLPFRLRSLEPTQPPLRWLSGALSARIKQHRRETDHWPSTGADVKKIRIYIFTPP